MDIEKLLTAGEWMEVPGVAGYAEFGKFKLKIALIDPMEYLEFLHAFDKAPEQIPAEDMLKQFGSIITKILALVTGWDFEGDGKPIPCTAETKILYLRRLLFQRIVQDDGTSGGPVLMRRIIDFSANLDSALKN